MAKRVKKHRPRRTILILLLIVVLTVAGLYRGNTTLQVKRFSRDFSNLPASFDGCRIAVLSDLHGTYFGKNNQKLFSAVSKENPDYIVFLGDLADRFRGSEEGYAESVATGLSAIAPTYYVTGNHEWSLGDVPALKERLSEHGVTVLSNTAVTLTQGEDSILLAGIDDPNGRADQKTPEELAVETYSSHGDPFWILLAHRNDRFATQYSLLGADLVLSGHGHGGIIRLPFTDGLLSTNRTFFPSYTAGFYEENGSTLFVTRGLGNSGPSFRLFNRPEVAILTLHKG